MLNGNSTNKLFIGCNYAYSSSLLYNRTGLQPPRRSGRVTTKSCRTNVTNVRGDYRRGWFFPSLPWEVDRYKEHLSIQYHSIPNGGPSKARNAGSMWAEGEYIIILDSDVILPPQYIASIEQALQCYQEQGKPLDAFGGPDAAHTDFTTIQKAINYSMTSFLTTGGIRGGKKRISHYYPRSFNLGCRTALYKEMGGFDTSMRYGEDLDFSMRLHERGAHVRLIPEAFVYHKRRSTFAQFYRQVFKFGGARVALSRRHRALSAPFIYSPLWEQ